jgi:pimeloyl-ACP methyl ester carboxylesterase
MNSSYAYLRCNGLAEKRAGPALTAALLERLMSGDVTNPALTSLKIAQLEVALFRLGSGRPVLYLHPGVGFSRLESWLPMLAGRGYQTTVPSHPGFGASARPDDFKTVEDLAYFYLDFIKQQSLKDVILIGSSFGGWIAAEIAVRTTASLRAVVLVDTVGVRFGERDQVDITDIYMMSDEDFLRAAYANPAAGVRNYESATEDERLIAVRDRISLCQYGWSPYMNNPRLKRWLHRIDVPTLCIWGRNDGIVSVEYGTKVAREIPNSEFVVIEGAGHFPQIEQPEEFCKAVDQFVSGLSARAA